MARIVERLRRYVRPAGLGVALLVWVAAFAWGFRSSPWVGFQAAEQPTKGRAVESESERKKRMEKLKALDIRDVADPLRTVKKDMLGDRSKLRGREVGGAPRVRQPWVSRRRACLDLKLAYPDKFGELDCMAPKYDEDEDWPDDPPDGWQEE